MKKSSFLIHTQQICIPSKANKSHTNIDLPQQDVNANKIIHSRNSQSRNLTNRGKTSISIDSNNQQRQMWRRTQTKSFQKFKTEQTTRSNYYKETQHRYNDDPENVQKMTTTSFSFVKNDRQNRKAFCISRGQTEYTLFNGFQFKAQAQRMKSQPQTFTLKEKIVKRINQKINLAKKMTPQIEEKEDKSPLLKISHLMPTSQSASLFKFDRFYDHCIKKLKKSINIYQKDLNKPKDNNYMQLKIESSLLSKKLKEMRSQLVKKKGEENGLMIDCGMGIIGKNINVKQIQKYSITRGLSANFKKKIQKIQKRIDKKNPFIGQQMQGWKIKLEKGDDFYI